MRFSTGNSLHCSRLFRASRANGSRTLRAAPLRPSARARRVWCKTRGELDGVEPGVFVRVVHAGRLGRRVEHPAAQGASHASKPPVSARAGGACSRLPHRAHAASAARPPPHAAVGLRRAFRRQAARREKRRHTQGAPPPPSACPLPISTLAGPQKGRAGGGERGSWVPQEACGAARRGRGRPVDADHRLALLDVDRDDGAGAHEGVALDAHVAQHLGSRSYLDVVANLGVPVELGALACTIPALASACPAAAPAHSPSLPPSLSGAPVSFSHGAGKGITTRHRGGAEKEGRGDQPVLPSVTLCRI